MIDQFSRRLFIQQSLAATLGLSQTLAEGKDSMNADRHFICVTCGMQFALSTQPPAHCPICEDERQYIGWVGQKWTTLEEMHGKFANTFTEEEPGVHSIHTEPRFGIGQRALLIHTGRGNLLWDCVSLIDAATIERVKKLGGIDWIAVSHPHYYTSMVEWSRTFASAPIYLHEADKQWLMRTDPAVAHWSGPTKKLPGDLTLIHTDGHFAGFQVLHWPHGAGGKGVLFSGDQPQVCMDRRWVSFMYSYPNMIPLGPPAIRKIVQSLEPFAFDRLHGAFPNLTVASDAKARVKRSAERYLRAIGT